LLIVAFFTMFFLFSTVSYFISVVQIPTYVWGQS
jgi:hypothetical protein